MFFRIGKWFLTLPFYPFFLSFIHVKLLNYPHLLSHFFVYWVQFGIFTWIKTRKIVPIDKMGLSKIISLWQNPFHNQLPTSQKPKNVAQSGPIVTWLSSCSSVIKNLKKAQYKMHLWAGQRSPKAEIGIRGPIQWLDQIKIWKKE